MTSSAHAEANTGLTFASVDVNADGSGHASMKRHGVKLFDFSFGAEQPSGEAPFYITQSGSKDCLGAFSTPERAQAFANRIRLCVTGGLRLRNYLRIEHADDDGGEVV